MSFPLYQEDDNIAKYIGIDHDDFKAIFVVWERNGFPTKDAMTGKRYWPAVKAFLDRRHNLHASSPDSLQQDGAEAWDQE